MPERVTIEVHAGKRYRVIARPVIKGKRKGEIIFAQESRAPNAEAPSLGAIAMRFYDGASAIGTKQRIFASDPADLVNFFYPVRMEGGPVPTLAEIAQLRDFALARATLPDTPSTYLYSDRPYYGTCAPVACTNEVSAYNLTLRFKRAANRALGISQMVRDYAIQNNTDWCRPMRSPTDRLADWDALEPDYANDEFNRRKHAEWETQRGRFYRVTYEKFDAQTAPRAQRDLNFVSTTLSPGMWRPSFIGSEVFHSWDTTDASLYNVTTDGGPLGAYHETVWPLGEGVSTRVDAFLQPRRYKFRFYWTAVYLNVFLWGTPIVSVEQNNGIFMDRLPFDWQYPANPESGLNLQSVSQWIQQSNRYALGLLQDVGSQIFSPYYYKILIARVDGLWTVRQGDLFAGELACAMDVRRGEAAARDPLMPITDEKTREEVRRSTTRLNVFRKTRVNHNEVVDWGSLMTSEIVPMSPGGPIYAGTPGYGPL